MEALECTHCQVPMSRHDGSGGVVRYFRCPRCLRWVSSTYAEVLQSDSKFRRRPEDDARRAAQFREVKARLERWLEALDDQDPYRCLGLSPSAPVEEVRARFHQLALEHHPDRGGSAAQMRKINEAYERVLASREAAKRREEQVVAAVALPSR